MATKKLEEPEYDNARECVLSLTSALADGELRGAELEQALAALQQSGQARARWCEYELLGEVMRSGARGALGSHEPDFAAHVCAKLADEPPRPRRAGVVGPIAVRPSANDPVWRWKLVAGLSSVMAVAVLAWTVVAGGRAGDGAPQLAAGPTPGPVVAVAPTPSQEGEQTVMLRDPRLDQLIAAHQQMGGASALQVPAGFLRSAAYERPVRRDGR